MDIRDRTLSALEEYIAKQRSLLETTQRDIQELQRLRDDALCCPDTLIDNLSEQLGQPSFSLSQQSYQLLEARQPPEIDWEVLQSRDPATFTLPDQIDKFKPPDFASLSHLLDPANHPLRKYVHESATNLLALLPPLSPSPPPERELSVQTPSISTPRLRKSQESSLCGPRRTTRKHKPKFLKDGAAFGTSRSLPRPRAATNGHTHTRAASTSSSESSLTPHSLESEEDEDEDEPSVNGNGTNEWKRLTIVIPPLKVKRRTQPTETFNQSWSLEEQHLLEQLLIEIPKGVKQRWATISLRMGGRRSARQVASRVQKYFEKLSKAGIDHPG